MNIENLITELIASKKEGDYWDFKRMWHADNEKLLHDILCFANTAHDKDCYIIIGVSNDRSIIGVSSENRKNQSMVLDLLGSINFAGDNSPEIRVDTITLENIEIDILTIFNSNKLPFFIKKKCKNHSSIREGYIYTRIGDKNTPIDQNSRYQEIEMLWKKRFGLLMSPLEQISKRLENKSEWSKTNNTYYNINIPDFKLIIEENDSEYERSKGEFYIYSQTNSNFLYEDMKLFYGQTSLDELQLVILDSGRYLTPVPEWGFIQCGEFNSHKITYKYYLLNSLTYKVQQFLFNPTDHEETYAKNRYDRVILYYANEIEKLSFEVYVENNIELFKQYRSDADKEFFLIDTNNENLKKIERERLSTGLALNRLLKEYRNIQNNDTKE